MRVYFSRSFAKADAKVYEGIRAVLQDAKLQQQNALELTDSVRPKADVVFDKIVGDIAMSDVVVAIFTRRHQIAGTTASKKGKSKGMAPIKRFSAPAFVAAEAAYATSLGKRVVLFLEEGVGSEEMGLVSSKGLEYVKFDRRKLDTVDFRTNALSAVESALKKTPGLSPDHIWRKWEVHYTVFPNGYALAHAKLRVLALKEAAITHKVVADPGAPNLPTSQELLDAAFDSPCPYPSKAFVAFSAVDPDVLFQPTSNPGAGHERVYEVRLPKPLQEYEYQWMWGNPQGLQLSKKRDFFAGVISNKSVDRVEILLRLHRSIGKRSAAPRLSTVRPAMELHASSDAELEKLSEGGLPYYALEETPLYRCYLFTLAPVPGGADLVLVY